MNGLGVEDDECHLLTDGFAKMIQLALGFVAMGTLWIKRELEEPKRTFKIWSLDVSKQAFGALIVHVLNIFLSMAFAASAGTKADECGFYFITFVVDVTLGTTIVVGLLRGLERVARIMKWLDIQDTGYYGDPPQYSVWGKQLVSWISLLCIMKLIVSLILWLLASELGRIGTILFSIFSNHRHLELFIVMILGPCCLNGVQFWITDVFLKGKERKPSFIKVTQIEEETI